MMGDLTKHVKDVEFLDTESRRIAEMEIAKMLKEEKEKLNQLNQEMVKEEDEGSNNNDDGESNKSTNIKKDDDDISAINKLVFF
jgi:hypothetical protein